MTIQKQNIPTLRFPGFSGEWEKYKLEDVAEVIMGQSPSSKNYTTNEKDFILVQGNADLKQGKVVPRVWTTEVTKVVPKDTLLLTVRAPVGEVAKANCDVVIGRGVAGIKGNSFIYQMLLKLNQNKHWSRYSTGTTFQSINASDIRNTMVKTPTLPEQQQIGNFFKALDDEIQTTKEKINQLTQLKRGLLQQLFPQKGEDKPRVRFPGFTDAWERYKLSELFSERVERSGEGELLSVTLSSGVVKSSTLDRIINTSSNRSNYKKVKIDDIAYNSMRMWQGASGVSSYDGIVSPAYTVITPKQGVYSTFFGYYFKTYNSIHRFEVYSQGMTSDTWSLRYPQFKEMRFMSPCLEEQHQISNLLQHLDQYITETNQKLTLLNQQKQALLQQMLI